MLIGCIDYNNVSSNNNGTATKNISTIINAITIDNSSVIPILNNQPTSSIIYIHNNSNNNISGITYSVLLNTDSNVVSRSDTFLDSNSTNSCASIKALQSCAIRFIAPSLSNYAARGSALITLNYIFNNQSFSFSQILNFQELSTLDVGLGFGSGVNISGFGNTMGYATIYVYGGSASNIYTINKEIINKDSFSITNSDISGQQIASNSVQAIEIGSKFNNNPGIEHIDYLTIDYSYNSTEVQNIYAHTSSEVTSTSNGGILITGQIPVIDVSESSNPSGSVLVTNVGNSSIILGNSTATTGISNLSGCTNGTSLGIGSSCTIKFNVTQSGGTGTITLNYNNGMSNVSINQSVTWFNSLNGALLNMSYSNPIYLAESTTTYTPITITNIGGYNLTNVTIPNPQTLNGGHVIATISYPDSNSCQNATLNIGQSCVYNLNIVDGIVESSGQISIGVSGSYNNGITQTYNRYAIVDYTVPSPEVIITTSPESSINVTQGESFTITATYSNSDTIVSFANANSSYNNYITYSPESCAVSSTNTSCTTTVNTVSNTPQGSYTTNITTNNGTTPLPSSINFTVLSIFYKPVAITVNSTGTYAFITDQYNGNYNVTTCAINGGALINCNNNNDVVGLNNPTGIAISDDDTHAFIVNNGNTSISSCSISASGVVSACVNSGATSLTSPYGIAVSGNYAYISTANASSTSTACSISGSYTLTGCAHQSSTMSGLPQSGITAYNGRAYIVFSNLQGYFNALACTISGASMTSCSAPFLGYSYNNYGIAISSANRAYITAQFNNIISCNVSGSSFNGCNAQSSYGLSNPYGIVVIPNGSYAFIVNNGNNSVSSCGITSGTLGGCAATGNN